MYRIRFLANRMPSTNHRRRAAGQKLALENLEDRLVPAVPLNNYEQYMLELINRGRADPAAEAARFGIDLNEGLPAGTITPDAKQPLAPNLPLYNAIKGHLQDELTHDFFDHTGSDGRDPFQRMEDAGYTNWTHLAENLAYIGTSGTPDVTAFVAAMHQSLFVDSGSASRGHRRNILGTDYQEIGPGEVSGLYNPDDPSQLYNSVLVGQDFGTRGISFLTGVVYDDTLVSQNNFYDPGEGLGGVTITAVSDQGTFMDNTGDAGGYALQLPAGTYTVTASGGALTSPITVSGVVIGSLNVKVDFRADQGGGGGGGSGAGGGPMSAGARDNLQTVAATSWTASRTQPLSFITTAPATVSVSSPEDLPRWRDQVDSFFVTVTQYSHKISASRPGSDGANLAEDTWLSPLAER
jgi:hypothetical protein